MDQAANRLYAGKSKVEGSMSTAGAEQTQVQVMPAELATFSRQLGAMLDAGVDILRALRVAGQHTGNERLVAASRDISLRMKEGREFYQALASSSDIFDAFYVEMIRQGEAEGMLGKSLL